ncbi:MAG: RNA-directed DNA polymerase [Desulfobacterales bacterium]|uniref:RNA-directed DNA polymerase n=1 Tax=Candidatus Desulfatibia profunda TaxID=2841695 RepID=A0A8J6TIF8_9BACT|nr:RNA-directed DNA polymerase [Candidatus Desulfatibia profunda]MBL7178871.1 RNA-directed DNA polymerase [Desulfobacterales bacterium]
MKQYLTPSIDDLKLECVLMQAWKKTSAYLRSHSWYADTLGLDYQSLRIPHFISDIQKRLQDPEGWCPEPIVLVPAPKNQQWRFRHEKWEPRENISDKIRPLAHVDLQDQVVATALMMCLADRIETALGDPRLSPNDKIHRRHILAYGHRLFCDQKGSELQHRWGSTKLYRQYFQDYQTFLKRSKIVAEQLAASNNDFEIAIIQSDFSKFYDRVRPQMLNEKLRKFMHSPEEDAFFKLAERVLAWRWTDQRRAEKYAKQHNIPDFGFVALPQGLVSAGFFANVMLADFESVLRQSQGRALGNNEDLILEDACFYVDDIRLVVKIPIGLEEEEVKVKVLDWLQNLLDQTAHGLLVEETKTQVTVEGRERRFLVEQSKIADRIQSAVSGPFDMLHGADIIGAIEGFFHTQKRYSTKQTPEENGRTGLLVGTSDMRDDTAARFAAGKFRRTFRSLRPLLGGVRACDISSIDDQAHEEDGGVLPGNFLLSKQQLDERAKLFAALLIEDWTGNPGNVRLLRIALDIYPEAGFLNQVLSVLQPGWHTQGVRGPRREVRAYCLAELFRAGATETGAVSDEECLPTNVSIDDYHRRLTEEAENIIEEYFSTTAPGTRFPWYLMQQVFLYLIARNAFPGPVSKLGEKGGGLMSHYRKFVKFLAGQAPLALEERAILLVIANTGFGLADLTPFISGSSISDEFLARLNEVSPSVTSVLWSHLSATEKERLSQLARKLGIDQSDLHEPETTLAGLSAKSENPFFEEENLLSLAEWLFDYLPEASLDILTPWQIKCKFSSKKGYRFGKIKPSSYEFLKGRQRATHLFVPPDWCDSVEERLKVQIGQLLRFALRGPNDFYGNYSPKNINTKYRYKRPVSHWEQQRYSGFQGRSAFGPPWLPLSSFTEDLLFQLLRWPGSGILTAPKSLSQLKAEVSDRLEKLRKNRGEVTSATFVEQSAGWPVRPPNKPWDRPLRIGIVQSVIPCSDDYLRHRDDPELVNDPTFRDQQRSHLAAMMEGVGQMLRIRDTHQSQIRCDGRVIDLLVFPELAIHPHDIDPIILPFVRAHKCIMLFGQVYHKEALIPGSPLINSCLWMIPEWSPAAGFQIRRIEQGKQHLAMEESAIPGLIGFRPAQWLIEYQWHSEKDIHRPLILSASVCYDATDLALASDLRSRSDLYIVCALNRDVGTFDRMSQVLHYHMFQGVIVVNNGQFGGSSFFMPYSETYHRQVFHLHGQPQATIAFAEIIPRKLVERPANMVDDQPVGQWKTPPAGWNPD